MATMQAIKTKDADGQTLDWLVCKCKGYKDIDPFSTDGQRRLRTHNYSANWNKAGPIMEAMVAKGFEIRRAEFSGKFQCLRVEGDSVIAAYGDTVLQAAMRAYVLVEMGPEVEVPEIFLV